MTRFEWHGLPLAERIWRVGHAIGWPLMVIGGVLGLSGDIGAFNTLSIAGVLVAVPSLLTAFVVERCARRSGDKARASGAD